MDGGEELVMMSLKYEWHNQKIISWTNIQIIAEKNSGSI